MASLEKGLKVVTNMGVFIEAIERMQKHFDSAPDHDPAKAAMLRFGAIDIEDHIIYDTAVSGGVVSVTVIPCPELQGIMDMVP